MIKMPLVYALCRQETHLRKMFGFVSPWLQLDRLEQAKVQVNTGAGGAFPCHFDLPATPDARRVLTVLLYLNPDWAQGDGGEVEIFPFPFADSCVPPLDRRLVAFSSCTTLHRVRPFHGAASRVCRALSSSWRAAGALQESPLCCGAAARTCVYNSRTIVPMFS